MRISVKTLQNKKLVIDINETDKVADIKKTLEKEHDIGGTARQTLIYKGSILKNDQIFLKDFKAKENDFIIVMVSKNKGGRKIESKTNKPETKQTQTPPKHESDQKNILNQNSPQQYDNSSPPPQNSNSLPNNANINTRSINPQTESNSSAQNPLEQLVNLGFERERAAAALRSTGNNLMSAVESLFSQGVPINLQGRDLNSRNIEILNLMTNLRRLSSQQGEQNPPNQNPSFAGRLSISLTEQDRLSLERLQNLGFNRSDCIQMYIACEKDEQAAANLLCEQASEMVDLNDEIEMEDNEDDEENEENENDVGRDGENKNN
ncbi:hypothetical protein MHBO_000562 [Bonamia ostreae]|uniref:UV excision repair protein RAD23 n=1 Tax=Bonamia ostreae TaxID=126728 RepID=A0ABV2AG18_9EUKA